MPEGSARYIIEVVAGLIPQQPEPEFTKRWAITGEQWAEAMKLAESSNPREEADWTKFPNMIHGEMISRAHSYAMLLALTQRVNWIRVDWIQV